MADEKEKSTEEIVEAPEELGRFGQFLKEHGIESEKLPDAAGGVEVIVLAVKDLQSSLKLLRSSEETGLDLLLTVSGVDARGDDGCFHAVYHLWSYDTLNELVIKVKIKADELEEDALPAVPSISNFWSAANWHERETYDLLGIKFLGHPYPRRILNPWDWDGFPLRHDYVQIVDALNDKNPHSFR